MTAGTENPLDGRLSGKSECKYSELGAGTMAWPKSLWVVMQRKRGMKNKRKKYNSNIFIPEGEILKKKLDVRKYITIQLVVRILKSSCIHKDNFLPS